MPTMNVNLNTTDKSIVSYYCDMITDASKTGRIVSTDNKDKINLAGFKTMVAPVLMNDRRITNTEHLDLIAKEVYLRLRRNGTIKMIREKLRLTK